MLKARDIMTKQVTKDIMTKEIKIKEIMTKEVISVRKNTPVSEVVELLGKNDITGVPVVEDDMTLVGIVTEKDVLRLFHADEELNNETVNSIMTQPAVFFDENEALPDVCDYLMNYSVRRVPVTSNGKVVGIISRTDLIKYIIRQWQANAIPAAGTSTL
ncbi:MAG: CBS domain-containing protein [Planctomycetota bacterium]|jgi:CBS domain-containing protein